MIKVAFLAIISFSLVNSWDFPWSTNVEQTGLVNTVITKTTLSEREERTVKLNTIISLLTQLVEIATLLVLVQVILCGVQVYKFIGSLIRKRIDKKSRIRSTNSASGVFEFGSTVQDSKV